MADIGDNGGSRSDVVVWKVPTSGEAKLFRMSYPDGAHPDARAMLIGADNRPIIITKGVSGPADIYKATAALGSSTVPMAKVGAFTPKDTGTPTGFGPPGRLTVTGAALSADGKKVVIRTLSDAYEWDATDDLVATITSDKYRITPLPNEANGSAIAYTADGKFVTLSNVVATDTPRKILSYTPAVPAEAAPGAAARARRPTPVAVPSRPGSANSASPTSPTSSA